MSCIEFAQKRQERTDETDESRYTGSVTPVKRDRDWRPEATSCGDEKPHLFPQSCGFFVCGPSFLVARRGSRKARRFAAGLPGTPTSSSHRPLVGVKGGGCSKHATFGGRYG